MYLDIKVKDKLYVSSMAALLLYTHTAGYIHNPNFNSTEFYFWTYGQTDLQQMKNIK